MLDLCFIAPDILGVKCFVEHIKSNNMLCGAYLLTLCPIGKIKCYNLPWREDYALESVTRIAALPR
jgi:hypothetical protein